jgi:hypothetical protein
MAFALWIDGDEAWAQGLHEYRPMGVAVIALTDRFRPRDFSPRRKSPSRDCISYAGLFASLGEVNAKLAAISRSQATQINRPRRASPTPPWI